MPIRSNIPNRNTTDEGGSQDTSELTRKLDKLCVLAAPPEAGPIVRAVRAKRTRALMIKLFLVFVVVAAIAAALIAPMLLTRVSPPKIGTPTESVQNSTVDDGPTLGSVRSILTPEGTAKLEDQPEHPDQSQLRLKDVVPVTSNPNATTLTSPKR
ncbi:MAG: hypothetical protein U0640_08230 [Phycisphaerales bacterium]